MKQVKTVTILMVGLLVGLFTGAIVTIGYSAVSRFNYDQAVCKVGGTTITRGQLAEATIMQNGMSVLETDLKYRAYVEESARVNKITVTPEELALRVGEYKNLVAQFDQLSDILGSKSILDSIPKEMLDDETRFTMLAEKVMKVTITDTDAMDWYMNNPKTFFRPKMVKLTLIKTKDYGQAKNAYNRLLANDPVDTVQIISVTSSDDKALQNSKGDVGWWSKESILNKSVSDAIFNPHNGDGLRVGEYTKPIPYKDTTTQETDFRIFYVEQVKDEWIPAKTEIDGALRFLARMDKIRAAQPKWLEDQQKLVPWMRVKNLRDPLAIVELP